MKAKQNGGFDIPDNGVETSAYSPLYAWGSNIKGGAIDYADTFLISPAIELTMEI
jgi:hypothetical protein